jgi:hypothetical protein
VTPLIVAIEHDQSQIQHLTDVAVRLNAELRLAESIDMALALFEDDLPDVILIPALLSSRDELALGSRLRDRGTDAAHVQTLTIPRFDAPATPLGGRMLSFRRSKRASTPSVKAAEDAFAEQLTVYLERATAIRRVPRRAPAAWNHFDPSEPRFVALIARLDDFAQRA